MRVLTQNNIYIALGLFFVLAVLIIFFAFSGPSQRSGTVQNATFSHKVLYESISHKLQELGDQEQLKPTLLIPGAQMGKNTWSFNGNLSGQTSDRPFFGTIVAVCDNLKDLDCWQLGSLTVNGVPYQFTVENKRPMNTVARVDTAKKTDSQSLPDRGVKSSNEDTTQQKQEDTAAKIEEKTEIKKESPSVSIDLQTATLNKPQRIEKPVIWRTVTNNVNARMGPGSNYDIAFKMPQSVPLTLVKSENKWGQFEYTGANNQTGRIWIAMSLVKKE